MKTSILLSAFILFISIPFVENVSKIQVPKPRITDVLTTKKKRK